MPGTPANGGGAPVVAPSPVVETIQLALVIGPDALPRVVIVFHGPTGSSVHFLEGENAERIGKELIKLAGLTKAGLSLPGR